jgi:DNA-binding XRE family transcriptional regulator
MGVQFIKSPSGDEMAVLPREEYEALILAVEEAAEDAADVAAYDAAMADPLGSQPLPADLSQLILQRNGLLKSIRLWRKLELADVAEAIGVAPDVISDLEINRTKVTGDLAQKLAKALDVPEHWLP